MILVLAHHYDNEAKWLARNLSSDDKNIKVILLIPEALGVDYFISFSLNDTDTKTVIRFKDDTKDLYAKSFLLVINRLVFIDPIVWNHSADTEKSYATNEINAFFSSFIYSFQCPVINQVVHGSLVGNDFHILNIVSSLRQNHISVNENIHNERISAQMAEHRLTECLRTMRWAGEIFFPDMQLNEKFRKKINRVFNKITYPSTLELFFVPNGSGFELIHISRLPALSLYGQPFLHYMADQVNIRSLCS